MRDDHGDASVPRTPALLDRVRTGDTEARERLIEESSEFILAVTSRQIKRGVGRSDDEFSVALLAFNEAIDKYDPERGAAFFTFAAEVIRRRLIDHYRGQRHHGSEVPWPVFPDTARFSDNAEDERRSMRYEIEAFIQRLDEFGIALEDLVRATPKHRDTRAIAFSIAERVASDPKLREHFLRRKALPLKALLTHIIYSPKTVQRHRKYITAAAIVLIDDFPIIREYLNCPGKGKNRYGA